MATLSYSPSLPIPKQRTTVTFTNSAGGDFLRVWCTVAPTGSELYGRINDSKDPRTRVAVHEGSSGSTWSQAFDRGGKYTFVVQEYIKGSGYGGGYEGDPAGSDNEEQIGSESTLYVYVGQRLTQSVGPNTDRCSLALWVWNATIQETTLAQHGEDSPALVANGTPTPKAKTAMESATVSTALASLVGQLASTALGAPFDVANYIECWNWHIAGAAQHADADDSNTIPVGLGSANTPKEFAQFLSFAINAARHHMTNDNAGLPVDAVPARTGGYDSGNYHEDSDGDTIGDWGNLPLVQGASSLDEAYGAFADLHRCFEAHRQSTTVHSQSQDTIDRASALFGGYVPELTELPLIAAVHAAYCAVLAQTNPPAPPAQSTGAQTLISGGGFKET